jgi:hypothetical protein
VGAAVLYINYICYGAAAASSKKIGGLRQAPNVGCNLKHTLNLTIIDFLETQRREYLAALNLMLNKISLEYETFVEPIEYKENISKSEIENLNYYRYDVFPKTGEDCYTEIIVNVDPTIFDTIKIFKFKDLDIFIKSFVWNASEFRFGKSNIDPTLLVAWFLKWININDDVMYKTFQTFIHGIIINETDDDHTIVFDFGTVEVNAIMELFELLSDLGVKKIEIESFYN